MTLTTVLAWFVAHWAALLAIGAATTAVNQFVQRKLAPKYPALGRFVHALSVDYWLALKEIGALLSAIGKPPPGGLGAIVLCLFLVSCTKTQAGQAVDATTAACIALSGFDPSGKAEQICATEQELAPIVHHLIAARQRRALAPNAPPIDACTVN